MMKSSSTILAATGAKMTSTDANLTPKDTILLIEDDDSVRDSLSLYLQQCGYNVIEAEDGEMGLALLTTKHPSVVVTDLSMPFLNGFSVLEALKEHNSDTPIIVISAHSESTNILKALRLGAYDFFPKPIKDVERLEWTIQRAIESSHIKVQNQNYRVQIEASNEQLQRSLETLERDNTAARRIQQAMLPSTPMKLKSLQGEYFWQPQLYVSGDFLGAFDLSSRYCVAYMADVTGHGVSAGFVTVFLKHLSSSLVSEFRNDSARHLRAPGDVMKEINRRLIDAELDKHATMIFCVYDNRTQKLHYSVAGHLPLPALKRASGHAEYLEGVGPPVGMNDVGEWPSYSVDILPGDSLVLASDGILELIDEENLLVKESKWLAQIQRSDRLSDIALDFGIDTISSVPDDVTVFWLKFGNLDEQRTNPVSAD